MPFLELCSLQQELRGIDRLGGAGGGGGGGGVSIVSLTCGSFGVVQPSAAAAGKRRIHTIDRFPSGKKVILGSLVWIFLFKKAKTSGPTREMCRGMKNKRGNFPIIKKAIPTLSRDLDSLNYCTSVYRPLSTHGPRFVFEINKTNAVLYTIPSVSLPLAKKKTDEEINTVR